MRNLPSILPSDMPDLLDAHPIEVRNKADAPWYLMPAVWVAWFMVTVTGKSARNFWMGMPGLFGKAYLLTPSDVSPEKVRSGNLELSHLPVVVHELTHCFRWIQLGFIKSVWTYVCFPFPAVWTGRSTEEFIAEANELIWILNTYRPYNDYIRRHINGSAKVFTSATYVWPTLDEQGWKNALRRMTTYAQSEPSLDALDAVPRYGTYNKFGGYLIG